MSFKFPRSFTEYHQALLDICFGVSKPDSSRIEPLSDERRTSADLLRMCYMVKVEFAASLEKEMKGSEDTIVSSESSEPNVFDVFLMETTMERRGHRLAVCMPCKIVWHNGKKITKVWYNGSEMFPLENSGAKWRVASLSGSARILEALAEPSSLTFHAMNREFLCSVVTEEEDFDVDRGMNESQRQAIATVVSPNFHQGFFAVQGPPGTGKTTTAVEMISAIGKDLLVTAPSNAAVANVALKLFATGRFDIMQVAVFGENCDSSVRFLNSIYRGIEFSKMMKTYSEEMNDIGRENLKQEFVSWLHLDAAQEWSIAHLAEICPYIEMDDPVGRRLYKKALAVCKVVFCTLNSSGSGRLRSSIYVDTIMLDEGGQCPEAEFFIATNFPGVKRVIVVGDPKQLPSTVIDPSVAAAGYGESWLGRIFKCSPDKVHLLNTQYRMDSQILAFPNREFYSNRIMSGRSVKGRSPFVEKPFLFIDTKKKGSEEQVDLSWQNVYEATLIKSMLATDPDIKTILAESENPRIIIITPYRAQAKLLKDVVKSLNIQSLAVATTDSFQGQEGDVVIMSTVRTRKVGFTGKFYC
jgi:ATP-dependent RNA/DNA helicase IGHMBP2